MSMMVIFHRYGRYMTNVMNMPSTRSMRGSLAALLELGGGGEGGGIGRGGVLGEKGGGAEGGDGSGGDGEGGDGKGRNTGEGGGGLATMGEGGGLGGRGGGDGGTFEMAAMKVWLKPKVPAVP